MASLRQSEASVGGRTPVAAADSRALSARRSWIRRRDVVAAAAAGVESARLRPLLWGAAREGPAVKGGGSRDIPAS